MSDFTPPPVSSYKGKPLDQLTNSELIDAINDMWQLNAPKPECHATMDVIVITDTWEARLLNKARQIRRDWLNKKHHRYIMFTIDRAGVVWCYQCEPSGDINTTN